MKLHIVELTILFLLLSVNFGQAQISLEDSVIIEVINGTVNLQKPDTLYDKNGEIKSIKEIQVPEIILLNKTETLLLDPKVSTLEMFNSNGLSLLDSITYNDFILKNKKSIILPKFENEQAIIHIITGDELKDIFDNGGWEEYHRQYKYNPIVSVSRPGFNKNKDLAFIYYSTTSGGLYGGGFFLILEKENGRWVKKEYRLAWIS
jgi:hypothetical protein